MLILYLRACKERGVRIDPFILVNRQMIRLNNNLQEVNQVIYYEPRLQLTSSVQLGEKYGNIQWVRCTFIQLLT